MAKEELEQKADRFCKDYNFSYRILSYNQTKRKSGALIAKESYIAGYHRCEKDTIHTDNKETLHNALKRIEELEAKIVEMKCCQNCKYYNGGYLECICKECSYSCNRIFNSGTKDLWEIKEND